MRRLACAAACLIIAAPGLAAEPAKDDGSYSVQLSAGVGRFSGDYGEEETTDLDVLNLSARWYFDRAELQVSLPWLSIDGGADLTFIDGQPIAIGDDASNDEQRSESGWGDVTLRGEYYLVQGSRTTPWVIGLVRVTLPTGDEDKGLGSGATDVEVGVGLIQRIGRVNWLADIGYTFVGDSEFDPRNQWRLGAGASVPFGRDQRHSYYVYLENRTSRFSGSEDKRSVAVGLSTSFTEAKRIRLSGSLFFGLSDSTEDVGLYVSLGRRY